MSDFENLQRATTELAHRRAECENASARRDIAVAHHSAATLLSQHEPVALLRVDREHLRVLLAYLWHGDADRVKREALAALGVPPVAPVPAPAAWEGERAELLAKLAQAEDRLDIVANMAHPGNAFSKAQIRDCALGVPIRPPEPAPPAASHTPSYHAVLQERDDARARATQLELALRQIIQAANSLRTSAGDGFDQIHGVAHQAIYHDPQ